jgi:heptosyltransferase-2
MRIVVRGTNWIGDAVMSVPALHGIRRIFPDAHIALHTRSWAKGIFLDVDFLDEIITYERTGSGITNWFEQGRVLRKKRFDLAIILPNSFESALTMKWAGVRRRFGYSRDARRILLTDPILIPEWKDRRHEVFYYLNLVEEVERILRSSATVMTAEPVVELRVSQARRERARTMLGDLGVDLSRPVVALGVGSTNSRAKRWLPENYARLNDLLKTELLANVILLGSKNEKDASDSVTRLAEKKPFDLTGQTDLGEVTAILSEIDLFVSNDMGLAHIAPAVGTKTLVIFGPTNPTTTAPFSSLSTVIRENVECSPCMLRDCPIDHRCMTRVSVDRVFEMVKNELS